MHDTSQQLICSMLVTCSIVHSARYLLSYRTLGAISIIIININASFLNSAAAAAAAAAAVLHSQHTTLLGLPELLCCHTYIHHREITRVGNGNGTQHTPSRKPKTPVCELYTRDGFVYTA
eukprot:2544-Heterococcus_DN1.PRE.1